MRKVVFILGLILLSLAVSASYNHQQLNYCSWMGDAASAVAKNRDLGIDEYGLISIYLKQNDDYAEQVVVLSLIDRIYGPQKNESVEMIALDTKSVCLGELLSYKDNEALN